MHVLIIDDNLDLKTLFLAFQNYSDGIQITVLDNAPDALPYLDNHKVDAVLVDLAMPYIDGLQAVEDIRRVERMQPKDKPSRIAFFTAQKVDDVVTDFMTDFNVEKVFYKPLAPADLMSAVKEWLGEGE